MQQGRSARDLFGTHAVQGWHVGWMEGPVGVRGPPFRFPPVSRSAVTSPCRMPYLDRTAGKGRCMATAREFGLIPGGRLAAGPLNALTDVPGVTVGHRSLRGNGIFTGVTAIVPHP